MKRYLMKYITNNVISALFVSMLMLILTDYAHAYLGPGAGLGMIGSLIAVIVAVVVVLLGLVIYPIRRLLKKKSRSEQN